MAVETELLIRFDEVTEGGLNAFTVLSGVVHNYGRPGSATPTEDRLYFPESSPIMSYVEHPGDAVFITGSFDIDAGGNVTITTLSTVFYYELFLWKLMYARCLKLKGTDV